MANTYQTIQYELQEKIAVITLNRPEKKNAFNGQVVDELHDAFSAANGDEAIRVILLKGAGDVFSAGADLGYLQSMQNNSYEENLADSKHLAELYQKIYTLSKPVVACITGHAIAGGCGLATVCDFAFSVPEAQFGYTEVKIGFVPAIVMVFLLRKVSERAAKELLLTGKLISADQACALGLINEVVEKENIEDAVLQFCHYLISNTSPQSLKATKQMIAQVQELSLEKALDLGAEINALARASDDCKYGIKSFLEKKKPEWN